MISRLVIMLTGNEYSIKLQLNTFYNEIVINWSFIA